MIDTGLNIIIGVILIVYFLFCVIKKISFKISFVISMIYFVLAIIFLFLENDDLVVNISAIAFYLLIISVALALLEYFRDIMIINKEDNLKKDSNITRSIDNIKKK